MYSAKKHKGKKLYELARRGQEGARKKAHVTIHSIELLSYTYPYLQLRVACSSGTYIRSLVNDLGRMLGTGALVTQLRRSAMGPYTVSGAIRISELTHSTWAQHILPVDGFRERLNQYLLKGGSD